MTRQIRVVFASGWNRWYIGLLPLVYVIVNISVTVMPSWNWSICDHLQFHSQDIPSTVASSVELVRTCPTVVNIWPCRKTVLIFSSPEAKFFMSIYVFVALLFYLQSLVSFWLSTKWMTDLILDLLGYLYAGQYSVASTVNKWWFTSLPEFV